MRYGDRGRNDGLERRLARLITEADALRDGHEQRREALIERAEGRGVGRGAAEQAYDLALEEGLEPAIALALVGQGVSVRSFGAGAPADATGAVEPEWIDRPPSPREATRERRLRETFRRVRSFLEREPTPRDALSAFAREPDLEPYDY